MSNNGTLFRVAGRAREYSSGRYRFFSDSALKWLLKVSQCLAKLSETISQRATKLPKVPTAIAYNDRVKKLTIYAINGDVYANGVST